MQIYFEWTTEYGVFLINAYYRFEIFILEKYSVNVFRFEIVMENGHIENFISISEKSSTDFIKLHFCVDFSVSFPLTRLKKGKTTIRENPKEKAEKNSY